MRTPLLTLLLAALLAACAAPPHPRAAPAVLPAHSVVLSSEPWSFHGQPGTLTRTRHYRLFTTETDPILLHALPAFLEQCLQRYTSEFGSLPDPPMQLDTFLMATRQQWMRLTRQAMGPGAPTYLLIDRGGFSSGGRALLWNIGRTDTLAIAAHEGWHQYTQRTFRDELPTWLEEGIGVYMEGMIVERARPLTVHAAPWANLERYDQLRAAQERGQLLPLGELLEASPEGLIERGTDAALTYYAQVWALVHFLREHDGGRHRHAIAGLLSDAAEGRLHDALQAASALPETRSTETFRIYFDDDLALADRAFTTFVNHITRSNARTRIARGQSPL